MAQTKAQLVDYGTAVASSVPTNGPYLSAANTVAISTNGSGRLFVDASGNVGVGTNPSSALHVIGDQFRFSNSTNILYYGTISHDAFSTGNNIYNVQDNGGHVFQLNGTERARIDSSGRLLVGTTAGNYQITTESSTYNAGKIGILTIGRSGTEYASAGYNVRFGASVSTYTYDVTDSAAWIRYGQNGGRIETFTAGSGTAGNAISYTGGPYVAVGGTSWTSSSDERLKEDLAPIEDALEKTSTLRAVTGRFKTDAPDKRRPFLLAQDVRVILPEAVDETIPDRLGLDYSGLIPLLVAALKESKERIETLEARLTAAGIA